MTMHISESELHDFVDAELADAPRAALARHLTTCAECRSRLHALEHLHAGLRALPRSIEPQLDLLPGIRARTAAGAAVVPIAPRLRARPERRPRWPALAAAAVVLCVLSSVATLLVVRSRQTTPVVAATAETGTAHLVDLRATETHYVDAIEELRRALLQEQGVLEPATMRLLEQSLATIDGALEEARQALAADPGNVVLAEMMQANYQKKLDLLRRASVHARVRL